MYRNLPIAATLLLLLALLTACGFGGRGRGDATSTVESTAVEGVQVDGETTDNTSMQDAPADGASEPDGGDDEGTSAGEPLVEPATDVEPIVRRFTIVADESQAGYAVEEEFFGQDVSFFTTMGSTAVISGEIEIVIRGSEVSLGDNRIEVNLDTLQSDDPRRDRRLRTQWLESELYPLAVFRGRSIANFPADPAEDQPLNFQLTGDMTIREITNPMTFDVTATLSGDMLSGTATGNLLMVDYGFEPPSVAGILQVTDGVTVTVDFAARE